MACPLLPSVARASHLNRSPRDPHPPWVYTGGVGANHHSSVFARDFSSSKQRLWVVDSVIKLADLSSSWYCWQYGSSRPLRLSTLPLSPTPNGNALPITVPSSLPPSCGSIDDEGSSKLRLRVLDSVVNLAGLRLFSALPSFCGTILIGKGLSNAYGTTWRTGGSSVSILIWRGLWLCAVVVLTTIFLGVGFSQECKIWRLAIQPGYWHWMMGKGEKNQLTASKLCVSRDFIWWNCLDSAISRQPILWINALSGSARKPAARVWCEMTL